MLKSNVLVYGAGYVGLSQAALLAKKNHVTLFDIDKDKIDQINKGICPLHDKELKEAFSDETFHINATTDPKDYIVDADYCVICLPTDFDEEKGSFNTEEIEKSIDDISKLNSKTSIIIKSTVPIGFTEMIQKKINSNEIIFSPEFLREGKALYDNYYPSRIIIGSNSKKGKEFANILKNSSKKQDLNILTMSSSEAECTKLFSNSFLSMKVAFYNELDNFALEKNISTEKIINGMSLDPRIGNLYNNPSFGYGGYCLPKDIKQLNTNYESIPQTLFKSIIESNQQRKKFIVKKVLETNAKKIGIYLLGMKKDSDNYRNSAIVDIIYDLIKHNIDVLIYEPNLDKNYNNNYIIENNFDEFVKKSDLIITNRLDKKIKDIKDKVFTRDVFGIN